MRKYVIIIIINHLISERPTAMSEASVSEPLSGSTSANALPVNRRETLRMLEKGSALETGSLLSLHDTLATHADPYLQIIAGWAALYASQKNASVGDVDSYFELAQERWVQATIEAESEFENDPVNVSLKAQLYSAIAPQIRLEKAVWTPEQRRTVSQKIGAIANKCVPDVERGDPLRKGLLAEIACLQLLWRDSPCTPILNSVPAGPGKDSRIGTTRLNTDVYAFIPGTKQSQKGVNLQVKSTLTPEKQAKYDFSVVVPIVATRHYEHPRGNSASPRERILYAAQSCQAELDPDSTNIETRIHLDKSSQHIHRDIMSSMRLRHPSIVQVPHLPPRPHI